MGEKITPLRNYFGSLTAVLPFKVKRNFYLPTFSLNLRGSGGKYRLGTQKSPKTKRLK